MACVNLPAFPLQLLIQHHPDWKQMPAVVVDRDKPQGVIRWVNKRALRYRILPGMRYAKALSLCPDLRAGVVPHTDVSKQIERLTELFRFYTPNVEPSRKEPGVFWLDATGIVPLHPSLGKWGGLIGRDLTKIGFHWSMAVGFTRYGTYAVARSRKGLNVFNRSDDERAQARAVPIVRLGVDPELRDALAQLAITTLGAFIDLPQDGIRRRFGDAAHELYRMARGELYAPVAAEPPVESFVAEISLDYPESNSTRLLTLIEPRLDGLMDSMQAKGRLLATITILLELDNDETRRERLSPAAPTGDPPQVLGLIGLRLQKASLTSGVVGVRLEAGTVPMSQKQLELFTKTPCRDLKSADKAFARLRAEFGDDTVMRARLRDAHLPEASFEWEPMEKLTPPAPRKITARNLVRRIFSRSIELFTWARRFGDELPRRRRIDHGSLRGANTIGPYIISGGWWLRRVHREYYYVRSQSGRWLWIYYDRRRRRSYVQGAVE